MNRIKAAIYKVKHFLSFSRSKIELAVHSTETDSSKLKGDVLKTLLIVALAMTVSKEFAVMSFGSQIIAFLGTAVAVFVGSNSYTLEVARKALT